MSVARLRMPREFERRFWRLIAEGMPTERAAPAVGVSATTGNRWFRDGGGMAPVSLSQASGRFLSLAERETIDLCWAEGWTKARDRPASGPACRHDRSGAGAQPAAGLSAPAAVTRWRPAGARAGAGHTGGFGRVRVRYRAAAGAGQGRGPRPPPKAAKLARQPAAAGLRAAQAGDRAVEPGADRRPAGRGVPRR